MQTRPHPTMMQTRPTIRRTHITPTAQCIIHPTTMQTPPELRTAPAPRAARAATRGGRWRRGPPTPAPGRAPVVVVVVVGIHVSTQPLLPPLDAHHKPPHACSHPPFDAHHNPPHACDSLLTSSTRRFSCVGPSGRSNTGFTPFSPSSCCCCCCCGNSCTRCRRAFLPRRRGRGPGRGSGGLYSASRPV